MIHHAIPRPGRCALLLAALLAGCDDPPTAPRPEAAPGFAILDGARGGTAHFFFLPPMVPDPGHSGTFDGTKAPEVRICELVANACGATITSFSGAQVKVELEAEAYQAKWKTKGAGLDPSKVYRIEVLLGTTVLGYADVVVLANGSQIRTVDRDQYVATINGGTLPIRFRIETAVPPPPPPGGWQEGDLITYSQDSWGGDPAMSVAAAALVGNFDQIYGGGVRVGISGVAGFSIIFTSIAAVLNYLPSGFAPAPLNADYIDPSSTSSGLFGGIVLALQFDVDFSDAGVISGTAGLAFGDLRICSLSSTPAYNGLTIRDFLAAMNTALGAGPVAYTYDDVAALTRDVTSAFEDGVPSPFAQQHLVNGACP